MVMHGNERKPRMKLIRRAVYDRYAALLITQNSALSMIRVCTFPSRLESLTRGFRLTRLRALPILASIENPNVVGIVGGVH